jgi:hypothetical protein
VKGESEGRDYFRGSPEGRPAFFVWRFSGLLGSEAFDRISNGGADGLDADGQQGYGEGGEAGDEEDPPADIGAVREGLEPIVHGPPRDGEGDEGGDCDEAGEVPVEQADDAADVGAEDLADADLFHALFGGVGDEAEEAEAGDEDREDGEGDEDLTALFFGMVELVEVIVHKGIIERNTLLNAMEFGFDLADEAEHVV